MKHTLKERLEAGLKALGYTVVNTGRRDYFGWAVKPDAKGFYFVGPNGGLRYGRCVSQSVSVGDATRRTNIYTALLVAGDKALAATSSDAVQRSQELYG